MANVTRQYKDEEGRCARLGNINKTFIDYTTFSHNVTTTDQYNTVVILSKLRKIFSYPEKFKSAVLWHWGIHNGLSLNDFTDAEINSNIILISAIQNMGRFLILTFGPHWDRRVEAFVHSVDFDPQVQILETAFIQYTFEVSCSYMFNAIRVQSSVDTPANYGEYFAKVFQEFINPNKLTFVNQLTWEALFNKNPVNATTNYSIRKRDIENNFSNKNNKQVCFPFLRNFLGLDTQSCNNNNCPRVHEDVTNWSKVNLINSISMMPRSEEVITAINESNRFL